MRIINAVYEECLMKHINKKFMQISMVLENSKGQRDTFVINIDDNFKQPGEWPELWEGWGDKRK